MAPAPRYSLLIAVTGENDDPTAVDDTLQVSQNSSGNVLDVLANDLINPDADETLTVTAVTQSPQGGTVSIGDPVRSQNGS